MTPSLREQIEAALEPFVKCFAKALELADSFQRDLHGFEDSDEVDHEALSLSPEYPLLYGDLRRARSVLSLIREEKEEPSEADRDDKFRNGRRNGIRWAVQYLHDRAESMNDPIARMILNSAAFNMGVDAKKPLIAARKAREA